MTSKRFIRRTNTGRITSQKSAVMNRARWSADRARRDADEPARRRELEEIETINLPRKAGDAIGSLQWTDYASGRVRRWTIRIGDRADRMTLEAVGGRPGASHGWTWIFERLRRHLVSKL
jgi:hypothetical protein